ncbi:LytR/AlgR family response regulator transcription factor [Gemmatirosa kalamazoonensis]|nr:LytTR family DNA-binding domain-containing protein [Gemmatirosa kalamazoonensis]
MTRPTVRVVIVDDEPLARRGLRAHLARRTDVDVVGECASGSAAVAAIRALTPDVVLLDVQMPGMDGFGVVDAVGVAMPVTVFVTAYDAHALRAFEAQALDYVLKPIDPARLARALDRAVQRVAERRAGVRGESPLDRFLVRRAGRVVVVPADDVDWIEADGDYARLHVGAARHLVRETMGRLEATLDPRRFVRIHRSIIANVDRIAELRPHANREFVVVLRDGTRLKLSRSYRDRLDARLGAAR